MTVFLVIILIVGNLLLISGSMFDDLGDNGLAWLIVVGAIVMDIYFIYLIVQSASKSREEKRVAEENKRIEDVTRKVETIIHQYTPVSIGSNRSASKFEIDPNLINKEVVFAVKSYKEKMDLIYEKHASVTRQIRRITSCTGCCTIDDKYSHLSENMDKLKQLKGESEECIAQLSCFKIELLNDNRDLLFGMKRAFLQLLNSKKCLSESGNIKDFITSRKPYELMLFKFDNEPIILLFESFYFCLFSNVILVFDSKGVFSTAIDPSALNIVIKRETTLVTVRNGNAETNQYVAEDSKCISQGITRSTWLHTRVNGSPDLRYSYNPRLEYRTDTYEYAVIKFVIVDKSISFSVSSNVVSDSFETITPQYTRKCNNRHNPIPELLQLMKLLSGDENAQIESIVKASETRIHASNYFCKLIAS